VKRGNGIDLNLIPIYSASASCGVVQRAMMQDWDTVATDNKACTHQRADKQQTKPVRMEAPTENKQREEMMHLHGHCFGW
jgi:hypothetical protein